LNSTFSANFNYHFQTYAPNTNTIVDEPLLSYHYIFESELVGPVFYNIYYGAQGEARAKHIIEPFFRYHYESSVAYPGRIITPYGFFRDHFIRYGLNNRIFIKKDEMPREFFTLGVAQTFYIASEESHLSRYRVDGEIPKFSDISGWVRFFPSKKYSLDFATGFNPYYKTFSSLRLGAEMSAFKDSAHLRVNWFKSINPYEKEAWFNRHQITGHLGVNIPRISLEAKADIGFNIEEREMLYSGFVLIYHYQCLDFKVELKTFYFRDKQETQFRISFGLGNIGKTTDFLGGAEY